MAAICVDSRQNEFLLIVLHMFDVSDLSLGKHNVAEKRVGGCIRADDATPHQRGRTDPFMIGDSDFRFKRRSNTLSLSSCPSMCIHMMSLLPTPPTHDCTAFLTRQKIRWVENSGGDGWSVSRAELM